MNKKQNNLKKENEKFLKQKRKRSKSSSNKSVTLDIKVTSFQERYNESNKLLGKLKQNNISQDNYHEICLFTKICDVNEKLMEKLLDYQYKKDFNSFSNNFLNYMFIISKEKRIEFQNLLENKKDYSSLPKTHFKKDFMKNVFEKLLYTIYINNMCNKNDFEKLKNSEEYYIDEKKYVFPLYKGNYESKYAYYIYLLFEYILDNNYFFKKVLMLHNFLQLIDSKEFKEHFKNNEELLYFMYQYMFISLLCIEISKGELNVMNLFLNYFFETYSLKEGLIGEMMKMLKIKYSLNKDLLYINMNNTNITINIYDYCFSKLMENTENLNDLYNNLACPRYFSIEKCFKEKKFINAKNAFNEMKDLYRNILKSKVYSQCIKKIKKLNQYENPFNQKNNGDKIIKDFENNTYYINIPYKLFGLTDKILGNIYINSYIKDNESSMLFLNVANQTWTHCHEYGFHGLLMLVNANSKILIDNYTPEELFVDDKKNKNKRIINTYFKNIKNYYTYDSGDKGETYIFGDKLNYLYLKGALYISNKDNWNNDSLNDFRKEFKKINNDNYSKKFNETLLSKCFLNKEDYETKQKREKLYKKLVTRSNEIKEPIPAGISRLYNKRGNNSKNI